MGMVCTRGSAWIQITRASRWGAGWGCGGWQIGDGGAVVVVQWWWCSGGGAVVVVVQWWWWCSGGGAVVVVVQRRNAHGGCGCCGLEGLRGQCVRQDAALYSNGAPGLTWSALAAGGVVCGCGRD